MIDRAPARNAACALLCAGAVMLAGCNQPANPQATNPAASGTAPAPAGSTAQQAAPYTPPSADQLYQMVAPIALFPDKLVAQVLAGSTYPDQITAADTMLQQNPNLKGALLADAVNPQSWDPSVKGLTQFPSVLDQMAQNIQWTTALGEAYVNDPADVMNAIQVMRQRAQRKGSLRNSSQMQVVSQAAPYDGQSVAYDNAPPEYDGPAVVPAPEQTIEILPAQPDTVYVPQYDPETVYGEPVAAYPGYSYDQPGGYSTGQIVAAGAIAFGVGIVVGALFEHHHDGGSGPGPNPGWGWNSWGMNWGNHGGGGPGGGWQRPAVVHNNNVYVSRSTTVVNRYVTNNINNSRTYINSNNRTVNNSTVNSNNRTVYNTSADNRRYENVGNRTAINQRAPAAAAPRPAAQQAMTVPHFGAPVRGAEPARFAHGGAPAQAERPQPPRNLPRAESANMPMARHAAPAPVARAPEPAPPVQRAVVHEAPREVARPQPRAAPVHEAPRPQAAPVAAPPRPMERAPQRPAPQPAARPAPAPVPAPHPAARPTAPEHHENGKAPNQDNKKHNDAQQH
ncbi:DUF3300 domain-containing protein [Dyella agri]|uniref:DUF3300 domain-containing protein n=1 Tax=Dyella agri TaxID=1926869 RepID=UPI0038508E8B